MKQVKGKRILADRRDILMLFVRYPHPGEVKKRLARDVGPDRAAQLYAMMTEKVIAEVGRRDIKKYDIFLFFNPSIREKEMKLWLGNRFEYFPQEGEDFFERMSSSFTFAFAARGQKVVGIVTDLMDLEGSIINEAFTRLDTNRVVVGPALDGGMYLLGMSEPAPELFRGLSWGTGRESRDLLERADELHLPSVRLTKLMDIDTLEDLERKGYMETMSTVY